MTHDGYSNAELLAIGTRQAKLEKLPMSASDINRSIPFAASQAAREHLTGFSDDELKTIAEGKAGGPDIQPQMIDVKPLQNPLGEKFGAVMDNLENLLTGRGMRFR